MVAVSLENITKTYENGKVRAVENVNLQVQEGELFGLIGADGAGKTTIFRILTTLLLADSGRATVRGFDVQKEYQAIRNRIGYMPGRFSLYQDLTVAENLHFFATLFGTTIQENYDLIRDIYEQIKPFASRRAGKLSGGMKQKLALCCALIHKPEVLFLDEPTTGVDSVSRREFWEMLQQLKQQGITILVSTPYMDEAVLCEKIALIQGGKIMSVDTPDQIINSYPTAMYAARADNIYQLLQDLRQMPQVASVFPFGEYLHITFAAAVAEPVPLLVGLAQAHGHTNFEIKAITPTIEDAFIALMQRQ
ncbi:ABC-type multidrug transport system, ATPase component [Flexibacter flexilis DSM 6793]|uniref:ABC-type multidrug transport system, ATPase component n=1 Tax=Flexibacter flexilis DSM 6793 TaxID=927664 RepID=A0A1I1IQ69_9BACT|nr:ABC transporter ATP-binding protein [Flexibacter flexilis]SFC37842.1 ABC-type multidrug transport system, ATPase component [Flexibacter flexilis DSM 6793]